MQRLHTFLQFRLDGKPIGRVYYNLQILSVEKGKNPEIICFF